MADTTDTNFQGNSHLTYLAGRAIPALIGFLAIISYSHVVSPLVYGEFAVEMGLANILIGILLMWIRTTLTRYAASGNAKGERMVGVALTLHLSITALLFLVLSALALVLRNPSLLLLGALASAIAWSDLNLDLLRARHQARRFGFQYLARQVLTVSAVVSLLFAGTGTNPIVLGFVVGNVLSSLLLVGQVWPRASFRFTRHDVREFLAYGLPLSLNYGLASLTYTLDRLIVSWLLGKEAAGIYALAADIVIQILAVIMEGITLAFLPNAARALDRTGSRAASAVLIENLLVLIALAMPAAFGLAVCGPYLADVFLGSGFDSGSMLLVPLLSVAFLFRGIRVFFVDNVLQLHHRTTLAAAATAMGAASLVALCLLLVPELGITGAGVATLVSAAIACAFGLAVARPLLASSYPVVDVVKTLLASIVSAGLAQVMLTLFGIWGLVPAVALGVLGYGVAIWIADPAHLRVRLKSALARVI